MGRQEIENCARIVRIVVGANEAPRLVHGERNVVRGFGSDATAFDDDGVFAGHNSLARHGDFSINGDLAVRDQCISRASGTEARVGQVFLQSNGRWIHGLRIWLEIVTGGKPDPGHILSIALILK